MITENKKTEKIIKDLEAQWDTINEAKEMLVKLHSNVAMEYRQEIRDATSSLFASLRNIQEALSELKTAKRQTAEVPIL